MSVCLRTQIRIHYDGAIHTELNTVGLLGSSVTQQQIHNRQIDAGIVNIVDRLPVLT